jgi:branched-subunit amino acid transport protein
MSIVLVPLAILMGLVTYPSRALPMLLPGFDRLPESVRLYLRLVGPAILAALAAVNTFVATDDARRTSFYVGPEWIAVALCVLIVGLRKSLLLGLLLAAGLMAVLRFLEVVPLPS